MIKEVTVYETTDGQNFSTWDEAYEHQFVLDWSCISEKDVVLKNKFGNTESYKYWFNNFDSAFYVEVKTPFGKKFIDKIADLEGVETITNLGRYRWDEDIENWISFEEDFKRFNEKWDKFINS